MKSVIEIDFETRSLVDITTHGAGRYAADPSTRILCVCWAVDNGPVQGSMGEEVPRVFHQAIKEGWTFSAFNAMFEQLIWMYRWPAVPLPKFRCTRALAASHGLPQSLDRACQALHIGWSKDIEGRRLINLYSKPTKDGTFRSLEGEDRKKMLQYCAKDVILSRRISQRLPALSEDEQRVYEWTVKANLRGLTIDPELAVKADKIAVELLKRGNEELGRLTHGTIFSVSQIQRIKSYLQKNFSINTASLDKEAIEELLTRKDLSSVARRMLELRRDLSQSSVKKFGRTANSVCLDGKVRDILVYHGAATGRWTSQVVQFQNLPKYQLKDPETALRLINHGDADLWEMSYKSPMLSLSGCIRGLVVPAEGKKLVVVDYVAIEARVLMWMAGQTNAVEAFRQGKDIYIEMAEEIYHQKGMTKHTHPKERQLGKTVILAAGFGMGPDKFKATCAGWGIDIDAGFAERSIKAYRGRFKKVPQFWYDMEDAAKQCVRTGKAFTLRGVTFYREREFLYMKLPSGRTLAYHRPGIDKEGLYYFTEDSQTFTYLKKRSFGGRLVENCIQALARDILAHGILEVEKAGWPVVLTVHDENVIETSKPNLGQIIKNMCDLPAWAKDCPITAEGFICNRYRKG
jgi:DNA polymerase bacteriophage-type